MNFIWSLLVLVCLVLTGCARLGNKIAERDSAKVGGLKIVRVNQALRECPGCHKSLSMMPVQIFVQGELDESMSLEQVMPLLPPIASNICEAVASTLASRGYHLTSAPLPLLTKEDWKRFDLETAESLTTVQAEYRRLLGKIYEDRDTLEGKQLTGYRMGTRLNDLAPAVVSPEAQAILLMDTKIVLESPKGKKNRIWTEDPYVLLALGGPGRIVHHAALVDARTREILWWASKIYRRTEARDNLAVATTVQDFFSDLPPVR